ncbi:chemotaxis protein CheB [Sulfobacillus thermosulfidooxidans]|uniref:chemotaxis protein CheB n=1 Tax=Sulfobacillus thermosulfidooxidans TaxID=28034 RepID=UPI0006B5DB9B|nr:chemotaxis protein CheB [Sulfobacillus thermosulfidooxidans]
MPAVMIVDDSAYARFVLKDRFKHRGWDVLTVGSGEEALTQLSHFVPDLITMDVLMPHMNGIETVKALRTKWDGPIIMVSSQTQGGADLTWQALDAGASDFVGKPAPAQPLDQIIDQIIAKYEALKTPYANRMVKVAHSSLPKQSWVHARLLIIGASTGGPKALARVVKYFRAPWSIPIVIVQHMPASFTTSLAARLGQIIGVPVRESPLAPQKMLWEPGQIILARGGYHLRLNEHACWSEPGPRLHGVIPAIDVTALDGVKAFGQDLCFTILTGMGEDGAEAAYQCHKAGGTVIVQDPTTAVVWGMPQAALNKGAGDMVGTLDEIGSWLNEVIHPELGIS